MSGSKTDCDSDRRRTLQQAHLQPAAQLHARVDELWYALYKVCAVERRQRPCREEPTHDASPPRRQSTNTTPLLFCEVAAMSILQVAFDLSDTDTSTRSALTGQIPTFLDKGSF